MIQKTEFGWTGSITDLPAWGRENPDLAFAAALVAVNQFSKDMAERDPRLDPQPGDKLTVTTAKGTRTSREVISRGGPGDNDIVYKTDTGKEKKCWISTWMDWAREAEVST